MTSCFDISKIDAWNTGAEDVTDGSVDDYELDWDGTSGTPTEPERCGCGCRRCRPNVQEPEQKTTQDTGKEQRTDEYPVVQL